MRDNYLFFLIPRAMRATYSQFLNRVIAIIICADIARILPCLFFLNNDVCSDVGSCNEHEE